MYTDINCFLWTQPHLHRQRESLAMPQIRVDWSYSKDGSLEAYLLKHVLQARYFITFKAVSLLRWIHLSRWRLFLVWGLRRGGESILVKSRELGSSSPFWKLRCSFYNDHFAIFDISSYWSFLITSVLKVWQVARLTFSSSFKICGGTQTLTSKPHFKSRLHLAQF